MNIVKIKTVGESRFNRTYNYYCGEVTFNEEGVAEVNEDFVKGLLERDSRLSLVEELSEGDYEKELSRMKKEELIELAKEIEGFDLTLNKKDIIALILKNMES